ncbi:MAG: hypothetical protein J0I25_01895 [Sphingomonadales bacterium]|nr:hypothetical protein [Sphingomonadales bacterium]
MILDLFKKKGPSLDEAGSAALEQALAQRAKMDLVFEEGVTTLTGLSCSLSAIGKDSLRLDVYGVGGLIAPFAGIKLIDLAVSALHLA